MLREMSREKNTWAAISLVGRLTRVALLFVSLYYVVTYVVIACWRMPYPFELEWMEGGSLLQVKRILAGKLLYDAPSLEYIPYIYTPLYYYLASIVSLIREADFLSLRAVSFLASLGCFYLIFRFVKQETGNTYAGIVALSSFAATFRLSGAWFDIGRVDSLALLFCLAALYLLRFGRSLSSYLVAGVVLVLCYQTKQSFLFAFLPMLVLWLTRRPKFVLTTAITAGFVGFCSVILLDHLSNRWYTYYAFYLPSLHSTVGHYWLDFWTQDVLSPLWALSFLSFLFLAKSFTAGKWDISLFYSGLAAGLIGTSWAGRLNIGGYDNVLMPAYASLTILSGLALAGVIPRAPQQTTPFRAMVSLAGPLLCLFQFATIHYDPVRQVPTADDLAKGQNLIGFVREIDSEVLMPFAPYLPERVGKARSFHYAALLELLAGFGIQDEEESGLRVLNALKAAITEQKYGAVIMNTDWLSEYLDQYYESRPLDRSMQLWALTGWRIRPCYLYLPKEGGRATVGYIELYIQPARGEYRTVVEWQDTGGGWHLVEGWQARPDEGLVVWAVRPSEFGKGSFRWVVYSPTMELLGISSLFYLPSQAKESVQVDVILPQKE